ncbi:MAG: hypothetical protein J0M15_04285 [Deltaproteobacteria bacterium]|nr:hypothetical protein [Deltaproteobacteria bacterium]
MTKKNLSRPISLPISLFLNVFFLLAISFYSYAQRVSGGAPKPGASFGHENTLAIAKNYEINRILGVTFGDEKIEVQKLSLILIDSKGFHYRLETKSATSTTKCVLDATVWNTHSTPSKLVVVTNTKVISGCEQEKVGEVKPIKDLIAITKSPKVLKTQGLNFSVEKIEQVSNSADETHFLLTAETMTKTKSCLINVILKNGIVTSAVTVTNTPECIYETPVRVESVLSKYKDIFSQFPKGINENRPYSEYLDVVRNLSPEKRNEIREHMCLSESKFYQVFAKKAKYMENYLKQTHNMAEGQALYMLYITMGFSTNSGGIFMPALIGMKLAPFFIVDADIFFTNCNPN